MLKGILGLKIRLFLSSLLFLSTLPRAYGQNYDVLHSFIVSEGGDSRSGLTKGNDGCFYGTTKQWGDRSVYNFGFGTIFKITENGAFTLLVSFNSTNGAAPEAALVMGTDGDFYGTTAKGGTSNLGTVFKMTTNGTLTTLISFTQSNGSFPLGKLIQGDDGSFYGTTSYGGTFNYGTVFKITLSGNLTTLVHFYNSNESSPRSGLIKAHDGYFYGTTYSDSSSRNAGTVFKMSRSGTLSTVVSFVGDNRGRCPRGELVEGSDRNIYGTTWIGGSHNVGTVFKVTTNGILNTLVNFNYVNGSYPYAGLIQGKDGDYYGTTSQGSTNDWGTVFRITSNGVLTTLTSFADPYKGTTPIAAVAQGSDGNLYGTTSSGRDTLGTIYRIVLPTVLDSLVNGNEMILSWSTNALGFTLQSAENLNSMWIDCTNSPSVVGSEFTVTNSILGERQFYRLKK